MSAPCSPTCPPHRHLPPHPTPPFYPPAQGNIHAGAPAPIPCRPCAPQEERFPLHTAKHIFSRSLTFVLPFIYCRNPSCPGNTTPFDLVMLLIWKTSTMTGDRGVGDVFWLMASMVGVQQMGVFRPHLLLLIANSLSPPSSNFGFKLKRSLSMPLEDESAVLPLQDISFPLSHCCSHTPLPPSLTL